jgi:hypothetical protein
MGTKLLILNSHQRCKHVEQGIETMPLPIASTSSDYGATEVQVASRIGPSTTTDTDAITPKCRLLFSSAGHQVYSQKLSMACMCKKSSGIMHHCGRNKQALSHCCASSNSSSPLYVLKLLPKYGLIFVMPIVYSLC